MGDELTRDEIIDRAEAGDREVLPALRDLLRKETGAIEALGNMSTITRKALLKKCSGGYLPREEAQGLFLQDLVAEVAGPNPSALEKLLAEQVGLCWLHLRLLETSYAQLGDHKLAWGDYLQRSIDRAHRRYVSAIKAMASLLRSRGRGNIDLN